MVAESLLVMLLAIMLAPVMLTYFTTHRVQTQRVAKSRGQRCGDIEHAACLSNAAGPGHWCWTCVLSPSAGEVPLTLVLMSTYAWEVALTLVLMADIDKTLNEETADKN